MDLHGAAIAEQIRTIRGPVIVTDAILYCAFFALASIVLLLLRYVTRMRADFSGLVTYIDSATADMQHGHSAPSLASPTGLVPGDRLPVDLRPDDGSAWSLVLAEGFQGLETAIAQVCAEFGMEGVYTVENERWVALAGFGKVVLASADGTVEGIGAVDTPEEIRQFLLEGRQHGIGPGIDRDDRAARHDHSS